MTEPTTPTPAVKTPTKRKAKQLISAERWNEVEQAWTHGKFATIGDLAAHFSLPKEKVFERMKNRGLKKGEALIAYNRAMQQELDKKAKQEARLLAERIHETREMHYKAATGITGLVWKQLTDAQKGGVPFSTIRGNLQALESAMKVLKAAREERFAVLGLDRNVEPEDEDIPELLVNELTPDQIDELRARDTALEDSEEEVVDLSGELPTLDDDEPEEDLDD